VLAASVTAFRVLGFVRPALGVVTVGLVEANPWLSLDDSSFSSFFWKMALVFERNSLQQRC
jgi:hypothetical protein